jgi:aminopeptidase N
MLKSLLLRSFALLALGLLLGGPAHAEAKFAFASTPGQLPKDVIPQDYTITLTPNLKTNTFQGFEKVRIAVKRASRTIVLNSLDVDITQAKLTKSTIAKEVPAGRTLSDGPRATVQPNEAKQTTTLTFPNVLKPGVYDLELTFRGKISPRPEGLYYDKYPTAKGEKVMLATQMEPTDARRMFPSWDEPVYRATFQLTVVVPDKFMAVSNTPIIQEKPLGQGLKQVTFGRTPKMSSYLMVLVAGELEAVSGEAEGVKLRIITTEGKKEKGRYALEAAKKLLKYYNNYFGIQYPLSKLDMIAIPGGFEGAMENWGGITYNEAILLFDPKSSSQRTQEAIFGVIAHEMAHQWFGNLVTMAWWDNLWLNEGFASWMGSKATDYFNPQWNVWLRANQEKEVAMDSDARRTTHAIQQPVVNESQAADAFDEITYLKGQSFVRMLETYLGSDTFQTGIRNYMKTYQYSNTTTKDLWSALEHSSGKPVQAIAAGWTEQLGFPVVKVKSACQGGRRTLTLAQERFTINDPNPTPLLWQIPVAITSVGAKARPLYTLIAGKSATVAAGSCKDIVKVNAGNVGYYRVQYDPALFKELQAVLAQLPAPDRVNLLSDTWALVEAGQSRSSTYLDLVEAVRSDTNLVVWEQVLDTLETIYELQQGQPGKAAFEAYARSLLRPVLARIGWEAKPSEFPTVALLRSRAIAALGKYGDEATIAESRRRFQGFLKNSNTLDLDLRDPVLQIVGRYSDKATYDQLHDLGRKAEATEEKLRYYEAMQAALDPKLAAQTLQIALTDELSPSVAAGLVSGVAFSGEQPQLAWTFAQQHMKELLAKLAFFNRNSYVPNLMEAFSEAARADELESYAQTNLPKDAQAEVVKGAELIRFKASLKARELPKIDQWVKAHS